MAATSERDWNRILLVLFVHVPCCLLIVGPVALAAYLGRWAQVGWAYGQYVFDIGADGHKPTEAADGNA
jgi:hypothetical protein